MSNFGNETQIEQISEQTITMLLRDKESKQNPEMHIFVGQHGAAKTSRMIKVISQQQMNESVYINIDSYRPLHPLSKIYLSDDEGKSDYLDNTEMFVRKLSADVFNTAIAKKHNMIFEHTFKNDNICNILKTARENGYKVNIHLIAATLHESMLQHVLSYEAELNYIGYSRYIPIAQQEMEYELMLKTLERISNERIYDHLDVVSQDGTNIFNSDEENEFDVVESLINFREKEWTAEQYSTYQKTLTRAKEMAELRKADAKYIADIDLIDKMSRNISISQIQSPRLNNEER